MKRLRVKLSLNPDLADFARADSEAGAFDSMSEYMRELIRQRLQVRITEDLTMLEKAIAGAPAGDPSDSALGQVYRVAKKVKNEVVFDAGVVFSGAGWRGEAHLCLTALPRCR